MKDDKKNIRKEGGPLKGVFLAAKNISNDGKIGSEGDGASTIILTEKYECKGVFIQKTQKEESTTNDQNL